MCISGISNAVSSVSIDFVLVLFICVFPPSGVLEYFAFYGMVGTVLLHMHI